MTQTTQDLIKQGVHELLEKMGFSAEISLEDSLQEPGSFNCKISVNKDDSSFLIGQYGANLQSIQHLARLIVRKKTDDRVKFVIQQYIRKTQDKYALADLYLPQLNIFIEINEPFQMQVTSLEFDPHLGRYLVGKINRGMLKKNDPVILLEKEKNIQGRIREIFVKEGRGYKMSEGGKRDNEIGYIEIDSIFSPVLSVSIDVENARVGKMTNWDKLVLNIKSDKTITPQEAFEQSVKILVDQFSALLPGALAAPAPVTEEVLEEVSEDVEIEEEKPKKKSKK